MGEEEEGVGEGWVRKRRGLGRDGLGRGDG